MSKWHKWAPPKEDETDWEKAQRKKEIRERVNGPDPRKSDYCDCGAKYDKDFPNIHSRWCRVYMGN